MRLISGITFTIYVLEQAQMIGARITCSLKHRL